MAVYAQVRCVVIGVDIHHHSVKLAVNDRGRAACGWYPIDSLSRFRIDAIIPPVWHIMECAGWV